MTQPQHSPNRKQPKLDPVERNYQQVLSITMRLFDLTDQALSDLMPESEDCRNRQWVMRSRRGQRRIHPQDVRDFATALGVSRDLFEMEPVEAGHWLLINRSDLLFNETRWLEVSPDQPLDLRNRETRCLEPTPVEAARGDVLAA